MLKFSPVRRSLDQLAPRLHLGDSFPEGRSEAMSDIGLRKSVTRPIPFSIKQRGAQPVESGDSDEPGWQKIPGMIPGLTP